MSALEALINDRAKKLVDDFVTWWSAQIVPPVSIDEDESPLVPVDGVSHWMSNDARRVLVGRLRGVARDSFCGILMQSLRGEIEAAALVKAREEILAEAKAEALAREEQPRKIVRRGKS